MSLRVRGVTPRTALRDLAAPTELHEGGHPAAAVRAVLAPEGAVVRVAVHSRAQGAWLAVGRRAAPESAWSALASYGSALLSQSVFAQTGDGPVRVLRDPVTGACTRRREDDIAFVWLSAAPKVAPPPWPDPVAHGLAWPRGDRAVVLVAGRAMLFVPDSLGAADVVVELFAADAADVHPTRPLRPLAPAEPALPRPDLSTAATLDALCAALACDGRAAFVVELDAAGSRVRAGRPVDAAWWMPAWRAPGAPPAPVALATWLRELGDDERYVSALVSARDGSAWAGTWTPTDEGRAVLLWPLPARGMERATDRDVHERLVALLARFDPWNTVARVSEEAPPLGVDPRVWAAFCLERANDYAGSTPARELQLLLREPLFAQFAPRRAVTGLSYARRTGNAPLAGYIAQAALAGMVAGRRDGARVERDDLLGLCCALLEAQWPGLSKLDPAQVAWLGETFGATAWELKGLAQDKLYRAYPLLAAIVACVAPSVPEGSGRALSLLDGVSVRLADPSAHEARIASEAPFPDDGQVLDKLGELLVTPLVARVVEHARATADASGAGAVFAQRLATLRGWVRARVKETQRASLDAALGRAFG